ncbi:MAG: glycosyltransferase family 2 protein [Blastocatellales bacterium]
MNRPLVSIIIPTFNHARYVQRSVSSALAQTWPDCEVIVVDDGSSDDTRHALAPFAARIRYHYQSNSGLGAARNTGIRLARGAFLQFLDADDTISPEKIEVQIQPLMADDSIDLVYSNYQMVYKGRAKMKVYEHPPETAHDLIAYYIRWNLTPIHSPLHRRTVIEKAGLFDEARDAQEDWDFMFRAALSGCCFKFVPGPFAQYYRDGSVISNDAELMYRRYRHMVEKFCRDPRLMRFGEEMVRDFIYHQNIHIGTESYNRALWSRARRHLAMAARSHRDGLRPDLWLLVLKAAAHQIVDAGKAAGMLKSEPV